MTTKTEKIRTKRIDDERVWVYHYIPNYYACGSEKITEQYIAFDHIEKQKSEGLRNDVMHSMIND